MQAILRALDSLGWMDVLPEHNLLGPVARFMPAYCLRQHARRRRASYVPLLAGLDALIAAAPEPAALAARGRVRSILDDERAEADFEAALAGDPACAAAWAGKAENRLRGGRSSGDALGWLKKAAGFDPGNAEIQVWSAWALLQSGEAEAALGACRRAIFNDGRRVTARVAAGLVQGRLGDWKGAVIDLDAAVKLDPRCSGLHTLRSEARWRAGDQPGAVADAHRSLLLDPENAETFSRLLLLADGREPRGEANAEPGLQETAEALLRREPKSPWLAAARTAVLRETYDAASRRGRETLREAAALNDGEAWLHAFLGRSLREEGLGELEAAARLAPDAGWIRAWRAETLRGLGRDAEALKELDEAVRLDPGYALAAIWRARLHAAAGDVELALVDLARGLPALESGKAEALLKVVASSGKTEGDRARLSTSGGAALEARTIPPAPRAAAGGAAAATLAVDSRIEMLAALRHLSGGKACPLGETSRYSDRVLKAFGGGHPAVALFAKMTPEDWGRKDPAAWILGHGPLPGLEGGESEPDTSGNRWEARDAFLAALRGFAPAFLRFFDSERRFYDGLLAAVRPEFERAAGAGAGGARLHFLMSPLSHGLPATSPISFTAADGSIDHYCICGHVAIGKDGEPQFGFDGFALTFTGASVI